MTHEYDTAERDLERAGMTLSRHPSKAGIDWRLTLPHGGQVEAWEPANAGLAPPPRSALHPRHRGEEETHRESAARELPSDDYGRFEELTRRLVSELPRAGSGAA